MLLRRVHNPEPHVFPITNLGGAPMGNADSAANMSAYALDPTAARVSLYSGRDVVGYAFFYVLI